MWANLLRRPATLTADGYLRPLASLAVALSLAQVLTVGVSLTEVPVSQPLGLAILLLSAATGFLYFRLWRPGAAPSPLPGTLDASPVGRKSAAVLLAAAALYLGLWAVACVYPDLSFDGNAYHVPVIHLWAVKGYVHWVDDGFQHAGLMNGYPKGVELLSFLLVRAFDSDKFVNTPNLLFLPLGALGIGCLASLAGASGKMSLIAAAAYVFVPVNVAQATTTYVDSSFASCVIAFLAAVACAVLRSSSGQVPWSLLPALGGSAGLALAARPTGVLIVLMGLAALLVAVAVLTRQARPSGRMARGALLAAAALSLGLLVGGYWYARNAARTGSPIYPAGLRVLGHQVFPGPEVREVISEPENTPAVMRPLPGWLRVALSWLQGPVGWPWNIRDCDCRLGGLGYIWLFGCLPALALYPYRRLKDASRRPQRWALAIVAGVVVLGFLLTPMNWWARYTFWICALGLPCFAVVAGLPPQGRHWRARRAWLVGCVTVLVLEAAVCLAFGLLDPQRSGQVARVTIRSSTGDGPAVLVFYPPRIRCRVFDEIIAGGDTVAIGPLAGENWFLPGTLSTPVGRRKLLPITAGSQWNDDSPLRAAKFFIWDEAFPVPECWPQIPGTRRRQGSLLIIDSRRPPAARTTPLPI